MTPNQEFILHQIESFESLLFSKKCYYSYINLIFSSIYYLNLITLFFIVCIFIDCFIPLFMQIKKFLSVALISSCALLGSYSFANAPAQDPELLALIAKTEKGNVRAQGDLGLFYLFEDNAAAGLKWLFKAAENGDAQAQFMLSELYLYDDEDPIEGIELSAEKAAFWFNKAIQTNDPESLVEIGSSLVSEEDQAKQKVGIQLLEKAKNLGSVEAIYELADAYQDGEGVKKI